MRSPQPASREPERSDKSLERPKEDSKPPRRPSPEDRGSRRSPDGRPMRRSPDPRAMRRSPDRGERRIIRRSPPSRRSPEMRGPRRSMERGGSRRSPPRRSPEGRGSRRTPDLPPRRRSPERSGYRSPVRRPSIERDDRRPRDVGRDERRRSPEPIRDPRGSGSGRDYPVDDRALRRLPDDMLPPKRPRYEAPADPLGPRYLDDRFDPLMIPPPGRRQSPEPLRMEQLRHEPMHPGYRPVPVGRDPFDARPISREVDDFALRETLLRERELELIRRERQLLATLPIDALARSSRSLDYRSPAMDAPLRPMRPEELRRPMDRYPSPAHRSPELNPADLRALGARGPEGLPMRPQDPFRRDAPREPPLASPATLEREVEILHKERDPGRMLDVYLEAKHQGIRPTRQTSLFLLSALAMANSPTIIGRIYDAVFEDRDFLLSPEQYHNVFLALSSAALPARVMDLYHQMHQKGVTIKNPQTFQVIIPCCESPDDAVLLFQDMKESGLRPTTNVCHALLQVALGDKAKAKILLDEIQLLDINTSKVLELMKSKDAWTLLEMVGSIHVEEPLWLQLLKDPDAVESGKVLAVWKRSPALLKPSCATVVLDAIMREPDVTKAADMMIDALRHLKAAKLPVDDTSVRFLMKILAAQKDQRIFAVYKDLKRVVQPDHSIFHAVLSVAAHHYSAPAAKEMWRDMHAQNLMPKSDALRFMIESVSKDAQACGEIMDVIAQSNLPFPPGSETFILNAFEHSEELRRRLPQLRQLFPNSTDPRLGPVTRSSAAAAAAPARPADDPWLAAGPHVGSQRVRHF